VLKVWFLVKRGRAVRGSAAATRRTIVLGKDSKASLDEVFFSFFFGVCYGSRVVGGLAYQLLGVIIYGSACVRVVTRVNSGL
jgi:hypothetical protein